jgi:hypothetical protein
MVSSRRSFLQLGLSASLVGCASKTVKTPSAGARFEEWVEQSHLQVASAVDASSARASEVSCSKGICRLPGGLTLRFHGGELIPLGEGRYTTTSFYALRDAEGRSLAKFPSREGKTDGESSSAPHMRVWTSEDQKEGSAYRTVMVYESFHTDVDVQEFVFAMVEQSYGWESRGVLIPRWIEPAEPKPSKLHLRKNENGLLVEVPEPLPVATIEPHGAGFLGLCDGVIIEFPKRNRIYRVALDHLGRTDVFPFIIG